MGELHNVFEINVFHSYTYRSTRRHPLEASLLLSLPQDTQILRPTDKLGRVRVKTRCVT